MPRRAIAKAQPLTPRQKEVYAHLCRRLRFPLLYGHTKGLVNACLDAVYELHGTRDAHPILSHSIDGLVSARARKLLRSLGVYSIQHLVDYETLEFIQDVQTHALYDDLVGIEVAKLKGKYKKIIASLKNRERT